MSGGRASFVGAGANAERALEVPIRRELAHWPSDGQRRGTRSERAEKFERRGWQALVETMGPCSPGSIPSIIRSPPHSAQCPGPRAHGPWPMAKCTMLPIRTQLAYHSFAFPLRGAIVPLKGHLTSHPQIHNPPLPTVSIPFPHRQPSYLLHFLNLNILFRPPLLFLSHSFHSFIVSLYIYTLPHSVHSNHSFFLSRVHFIFIG